MALCSTWNVFVCYSLEAISWKYLQADELPKGLITRACDKGAARRGSHSNFLRRCASHSEESRRGQYPVLV